LPQDLMLLVRRLWWLLALLKKLSISSIFLDTYRHATASKQTNQPPSLLHHTVNFNVNSNCVIFIFRDENFKIEKKNQRLCQKHTIVFNAVKKKTQKNKRMRIWRQLFLPTLGCDAVT